MSVKCTFLSSLPKISKTSLHNQRIYFHGMKLGNSSFFSAFDILGYYIYSMQAEFCHSVLLEFCNEPGQSTFLFLFFTCPLDK